MFFLNQKIEACEPQGRTRILEFLKRELKAFQDIKLNRRR